MTERRVPSGHNIKGVEVEVQEALPKPAEEKAAGSASVSVVDRKKLWKLRNRT